MKIVDLKPLIAGLLLAVSIHSLAQTEVHDHRQIHENDDPLLTKVMIDQLEWRNADGGDLTALEGELWVGRDLNKLWLKTTAEFASGDPSEAELQALYSHAISPYWDVQTGLRYDDQPGPGKTWGVIGLKGLAPYFFDVDSAVFVGDSGDIALRLKLEYELMLTQRWVLSPQLELNVYGQNDAQRGTGAGISDLHSGLRLRYEIRREFAPYVGINWRNRFGKSADYAEDAGEAVNESEWVAGIRVWF